MTTDKPQIDVQLPNDQILVERTEVLRNKMTKDSVNKIARTVINSHKISDISLKYTDNNQEVAVRIDKNRLARMISDVEGDVVVRNVPNVRLEIVSPTLEDKSVQWKVRYDGGSADEDE